MENVFEYDWRRLTFEIVDVLVRISPFFIQPEAQQKNTLKKEHEIVPLMWNEMQHCLRARTPQLCKTFIWATEKWVYKNNLHFRKTNDTIQMWFYSNRTDLNRRKNTEKEKRKHKNLELDVTNQLLLAISRV